MSAIASFHLLAREDLGSLLEAAVPRRHEGKRALPFLKPRVVETDAFRPFLMSEATELQVFGFSGWAFNDLDFILQSRGITLFEPGSLTAESEQLSVTRRVSSILFDSCSARRLIERLEAVELSSGQVAEYLQAEHGESEPTAVEAVLAALSQTREWLSQVTPDSIGLLSVG